MAVIGSKRDLNITLYLWRVKHNEHEYTSFMIPEEDETIEKSFEDFIVNMYNSLSKAKGNQ